MKFVVYCDYGPDVDPMLFETYEDAYEEYNYRVREEPVISTYLCVVIDEYKAK
ncbi:hypothetical protein [Bacillus subtilis]|uniref:hypothetical protein n=1 Tax=Bacillus subtilis TaxID=1423 RepID=UPI00129EA64C|nr:hypothetical protein [Bacillus subtilis]QGI00217.1 hypothetical protein GII77_06985 [Bacillus subtilis]QUG79148.1 hypothetical protein GSN02_06615 [Bacillus subtilis]